MEAEELLFAALLQSEEAAECRHDGELPLPPAPPGEAEPLGDGGGRAAVGCSPEDVDDLLLALQLQAEEEEDAHAALAGTGAREGTAGGAVFPSPEGSTSRGAMAGQRASSGNGPQPVEPRQQMQQEAGDAEAWGAEVDDLLLALQLQAEEESRAPQPSPQESDLQDCAASGSPSPGRASAAAPPTTGLAGAMQWDDDVEDLLLALELQADGRREATAPPAPPQGSQVATR